MESSLTPISDLPRNIMDAPPDYFLVFILFIVLPLIYGLPLILAYIRKNPDVLKITALNVVLGWTVIGWVFALLWAFKRTPEKTFKKRRLMVFIGAGVFL